MKPLALIGIALVIALAGAIGYRLGRSQAPALATMSDAAAASATTAQTPFAAGPRPVASPDEAFAPAGASPTPQLPHPSPRAAAARTREANTTPSAKHEVSAAPESDATEPIASSSHPGSSPVHASPRAPIRTASQRALEATLASGRPPMPLALQGGTADNGALNPATRDLTPAQQEAARRTADEFVEAIGGVAQNPDDPAYLDRWIKATLHSDVLLRQRLGVTAWQRLKIEAAQQAYREANPQFEEGAQP